VINNLIQVLGQRPASDTNSSEAPQDLPGMTPVTSAVTDWPATSGTGQDDSTGAVFWTINGIEALIIYRDTCPIRW
jgi:hypothetical protein